jgi:uncharacterized protein (DUF362 family)
MTAIDQRMGDPVERERSSARVALERATYSAGDCSRALRALATGLGWADGASAFGRMIPRGARVLVKPNWVMHENHGPWGVEPLYTHPALIRSVVDELLATGAGRVVVGDAPLQSCDFGRLMRETGLETWAATVAARSPAFGGLVDFRRTRCVFENGIRTAVEDQVPLDQFVLFDLGADSLLEPVTDGRASFRVTQYDPHKLSRTHGPGRHQYLVARDVIAADVIVNLPKLKTHKKAGITCALKNLIGINGNKEFLPHHRIGGSEVGGDCYPGRNPVKRALEYTLDRLNQTRGARSKRAWHLSERVLNRLARASGDELGVEGSWHGNDTIWRTCLDLNRILLYGRLDGTLADEPQREVMNVVDAVMAGHGDGPLSPQPLPLGLLMAGGSSAAIDWIGAQLLGYDPSAVSIAREAFSPCRWPLTDFAAADIELTGALGAGRAERVLADSWTQPAIEYPVGWVDAVRPPSTFANGG